MGRPWLVPTRAYQLTRGATAVAIAERFLRQRERSALCPPARTAHPPQPCARATISSPGSRRAPSLRSAWRIGTEHEKFLFYTDTLKPVPYEGPRGVRALMEALIARFGWQPIMEGDNIIALKRPEGEGPAAPCRSSPAASSSSPARR